MADYIYKKRQLTNEEIELLDSEIKEDPYTSGYSKREWNALKHVIVAEKDGELAGMCACDKFIKDWAEIGLLFVRKKFRKESIGSSLVINAINDCRTRRQNMFIVSRNPILVNKFESFGFKKCTLFELPVPVIIASIVFSLHFYRIKENIKKLFNGNIKGVPSFGYIIVNNPE